jgi:hypothetical protein
MTYAYLGVWVNDEDLFRFLSFILTCKTFSPWQAFLTVVYPNSLLYIYIFLYSDSRSSVSSMLGHVSTLIDDCSSIFVSLVLAPFAESAKLTSTNL